MPDVSVLIVTWNSARFIAECLESIYGLTRGHSLEVIVVDNGSTDGTTDIVRREFPGVRLVEAGANLGFARATNVALRLARGRFLFLLNPDTRLQSDAVGALARFLETHPDAGCCGPRIFESDGSDAVFSGREFPSILGALFSQLGLQKLFPSSPVFGKAFLPRWDRRSVRAVPCLVGAAMMMPRAVLEEVGYLDEELPMYFEDMDLCARIAASGRRLYCVPSAEIVHLGGQSTALSPVRPVLLAMEMGQAHWLYFRRHVGRAPAAAYTAVLFFGSLYRLLLALLVSPLLPFMRPAAAARVRTRAARAWTLLKWSLSRKRDFAKRFAGMFATSPDERALAAMGSAAVGSAVVGSAAARPSEAGAAPGASARRTPPLTEQHVE
jgi:GT2 family glycosyltransferase